MTTPHKGTQSYWRFSVLVLLCVLAYWAMFRNGFVWDDAQFIVANPAIRGLWPPARFLQPQGSAAEGAIYPLTGQRPVMTFSLALDYALWKLNPFGYHLTSLLLHLLCVTGVAYLAQRLSRSPGVGFLAGALFALLPGHAEGVIAFLGRSDLLATLFVLLGLWGYVQHLGSKGWPKALWYVGSLLGYLIACFSKENGLVLLGILVLYEGFVIGKFAGTWRKRGLRLLPFLGIALLYWWYRGRILGGQAAGSVWWGGSREMNFLMAFEAYARYLRLLFFPLSLSPAHRVPVPAGFMDTRVLWGLALLFVTIGGAIWALIRNPRTGFLASWFAIGLIPVANFIPIPGLIAAERWLYLPSVGACALGGWGAWALYRRARGWPRAVWTGLIGIALLLFGIRTELWSPAWRSEESLARAVLAADPGYALGHSDLGSALVKQGRYAEAEVELREAIRLKPDYAQAHNNLGNILGAQGRLDEAEQEYRQVIHLAPDYAESHYNLGNILNKQGKLVEAEQAYQEALRLAPVDPRFHNNLGALYFNQGRLGEAEKEYREAIRIKPDHAEAHLNLGYTLILLGKREEAGRELGFNLRLAPEVANRAEVEALIQRLEH